ncbi:MAG: ATPase [Dictyoglomus sp. NZ13-RE01]|nr:MAG: ATPase [Dictyoglomus sp. NZ13-RE01]
MLNRSIELISELKKLLEKSFVIPIIDRVIIDYDRLKSLINELDHILPNEIIEANEILKNKDEIIDEAKKEAEAIVKIAREKADYLLNENTITQRAEKEAEEIKREAEKYALSLLIKVEEILKKELAIIEEAKNQLK